jgi:hypothetical protein
MMAKKIVSGMMNRISFLCRWDFIFNRGYLKDRKTLQVTRGN